MRSEGKGRSAFCSLRQAPALLAALLLTGMASALCQPPPPSTGTSIASLDWKKNDREGVIFEYTDADRDQMAAIEKIVTRGRQTIKRFFGRPFPQPFVVRIYPDRASLTQFWRKDWKIPNLQPESWMVASGTSRTLSILSPRVWATQATEHDPKDKKQTEHLIIHELVHVFHAQSNPRPDFEGMDDIGWFVEGLAVYVSGQLEDQHLASAREAVETGKTPRELKTAWSGKYRYGVSGSLVRYIAAKYGRKKIIDMLAATSEKQIMDTIGLTEKELLANWQRAVSSEKPPPSLGSPHNFEP